MAKERDEFGEVKTNIAGEGGYKDEKTEIIQSIESDIKSKDSDEDVQADAEKTSIIFGTKKVTTEGAETIDQQVTDTERIGKVSKLTEVPCVGWLVVWEGPGKGASHVLQLGNNTIGRDESCDVTLSHGDHSISSDGKVSIDYEYRGHSFAFVNRGSKNTPYLNDEPIRTEKELNYGDKLMIGETTLIFIPFCSQERNWS